MSDVHEPPAHRRRLPTRGRAGMAAAVIAVGLLLTACNPSGNSLEGQTVISLHKELFGTNPVGRVSCTTRKQRPTGYVHPHSEAWEGSCTLDGRTYRVTGDYLMAPPHEGGKPHSAIIVAENHSPPHPDHYFCSFRWQPSGTWVLSRRCELALHP